MDNTRAVFPIPLFFFTSLPLSSVRTSDSHSIFILSPSPLCSFDLVILPLPPSTRQKGILHVSRLYLVSPYQGCKDCDRGGQQGR